MSVRACCIAAVAAIGLTYPGAASADLKLSQLIVDFEEGARAHDIELWNDSAERTFVAVEPREIINPGFPNQADRRDPDPLKLGLLTSPSRLILEPGQRRLLRIASLSLAGDHETVYRVTVKPVAGALKTSAATGIKVMVGYDILVLVRPAQMRARITGTRQGGKLVLNNDGNSSVELIDGRECDAQRKSCSPLGGKRLYAGASWTIDVLPGMSAEFTIKKGLEEERRAF